MSSTITKTFTCDHCGKQSNDCVPAAIERSFRESLKSPRDLVATDGHAAPLWWVRVRYLNALHMLREKDLCPDCAAPAGLYVEGDDARTKRFAKGDE